MVSIWFYQFDMIGVAKSWQFARNVSWAEYERMSANQPGEGQSWRADFSF